MKWLYELLMSAVYSLFIQNLIFNSGLALSETVRMSRRPKFFPMYTGTIVYYTGVTALVCSLLDKIEAVKSLGIAWHILIFALAITVIHIITSVFVIVVMKANKKYMNSLGMCAVNSLVLAIPMINNRSANTVFSSLGAGIGAGLAFMLAVILINSAMKQVALNKDIPKPFRGLPAVFIYVAVISLALTCLSGQALFI